MKIVNNDRVSRIISLEDGFIGIQQLFLKIDF